MANKKSSSLAKKLIDDLLDDDLVGEQSEIITHAPPKMASGSKGTPSPSKGKPFAFQVASLAEDEKTVPVQADDRTIQLSDQTEASLPEVRPDDQDSVRATQIFNSQPDVAVPDSSVFNQTDAGQIEDKIRTGVGKFAPVRTGPVTATDAALAHAENLRIAQGRILELEAELERSRQSNEQLAAAGETLRRRVDQALAEVESLSARYQNLESSSEDEKMILQKSMQAKDKELITLRSKVEEMEMRVTNNIHKVRVRERELENRLELVKMESQALLRSKDELILDLKRQVDQLNQELNNYRNKGQELHKQMNDKNELMRRTVKALRLALSMIEGESESVKGKGNK